MIKYLILPFFLVIYRSELKRNKNKEDYSSIDLDDSNEEFKKFKVRKNKFCC